MGFDCTWSAASAARCVADSVTVDWSTLIVQATWTIAGAVLGSLMAIAALQLFFGRLRG